MSKFLVALIVSVLATSASAREHGPQDVLAELDLIRFVETHTLDLNRLGMDRIHVYNGQYLSEEEYRDLPLERRQAINADSCELSVSLNLQTLHLSGDFRVGDVRIETSSTSVNTPRGAEPATVLSFSVVRANFSNRDGVRLEDAQVFRAECTKVTTRLSQRKVYTSDIIRHFGTGQIRVFSPN